MPRPEPPKEPEGWSHEAMLYHLEQRLHDIVARLDERWNGHIHWSESEFSNVRHRMDQTEARLTDLAARLTEMEGARAGLRTGWTVLVATVATASAIFLIIDFFVGR